MPFGHLRLALLTHSLHSSHSLCLTPSGWSLRRGGEVECAHFRAALRSPIGVLSRGSLLVEEGRFVRYVFADGGAFARSYDGVLSLFDAL